MKKLSLLLLFTFAFINIFAQQTAEPAFCKNPPAGIQVGGGFSYGPQYGCTDQVNTSATFNVFNGVSPTGGALTQLGYIFDIKDGDNLVFSNKPQTSFTASKPGIYWILQAGNDKGVAYIACSSVELIQTEQPDFAISTCGDKSETITFLDTPKNRKHGRYRIVWGDGTQNLTAQITALPLSIQHTYENLPTQKPQIYAEYTRLSPNIVICRSAPIEFAIGSFKPRINELEGLNGGASAKITLSEGLDGNTYSIQQKIKDGAWADTGKKITRNSGTTSAQQTIDSLKSANEYCFRLQSKDACGNEILSNEVCTIKLNATFLSDKEVKLDWTIPDPNVSRYTISYNESPTGANPNTILPLPLTANSYVFNAIDCNKKYDFNIAIAANLGTTIIKSPKILVDPSTVKELPAPDNIVTVSAPDSKTLIFSIFESSGFTKAKYLFYRSLNGGSFEKIGEDVNNTFMEKNVDLEKNQYCYTYKYESACGIQSVFSIYKPCNIKLSIENTTLKWTPFLLDNTSTNKPVYIIELLDEKGSPIKLINTTIETSLDVKSIIDFEKTGNYITPKFRILGRINYTLNVDGTPTPFPLDVYSNTVTYTPILSTSSESEALNIYPNPSEEIIQFNSNFLLKTAEIVDLQGKIVQNQAIEENQVSVKKLPKGKYILRLYDQEKRIVINKTIEKL